MTRGALLVTGLAAAAAAVGWWDWRAVAEIRSERTAAAGARRRADSLAALAAALRDRVVVERLRGAARATPGLALAVSLDSGSVTMLRDGLPLRRMGVSLGRADPRVPEAAGVTRGSWTVDTVLGPRDPWEVPAWAWAARGLPVPDRRIIKGALGPVGVLLEEGGPTIYAVPDSGPLADSTWVAPNAIRLRAADLKVLKPNLVPGTRVFVY